MMIIVSGLSEKGKKMLCKRIVPGDEVTLLGNPTVNPGEYLPGTRLLCIRRNKRDKWWQFWKPRYTSATFRYMRESEA